LQPYNSLVMSLFIGNTWRPGRGEDLASTNPATNETVWSGKSASPDDVHEAVVEADTAGVIWSERPVEDRIRILNAFADQLAHNKAALAELISKETGKPRWESSGEVESMRGKVAVSIESFNERRRESSRAIGDATGNIRYKPYGSIAVLGPFNFPGHLPNGHIVPALLAGNTVVFKPSELTPGVAEMTVQLWEKAGIPRGVINLVQGFSPIDSLSTGRSVTWGHLGLAVTQIVMLLGGIFSAIGIITFTRRELATAQGTT
jgi:succinylglutamic semialdehyde dehydrogenase